MSKRIAFFMGAMGRGGAERVVSILSRCYCKRGWQVDICTLLHSNNEYQLHKQVTLYDFSNECCKNLVLRKLKMLGDIRTYMKHNKPDVAVPFLAKTSVLFDIAMAGIDRKGTRLVASERIDPFAANYFPVLRALVNRSFEHADWVVFQTKKAQRYYGAAIRAKSDIIGNPITIDVQRAETLENVVITGGRLEPQKNQQMLISAFASLAEKYPAWRLDIYGEGSLREQLTAQIRDLKMESRIYLMGNRPNYQQCLANGRVFVLPSNFEGLSNALLEAMMLGLPCISTDCAGSDEIIENGINGLMIPVGDGEKLAQALDLLLSDSDMQTRLGNKGRETVAQFATDVIISKWEKVFENHLG